MGIGEKIKVARREIGFTQEEVAESLMVSRQTISNWENGRSLPDIVSVIKMSELYKVSLDELLKGDHEMMEKIEKDTKLIKSEKKVVRYAFVSIAVGIILLVLGAIFEGNQVIDFLNGAVPWILLGLAFLFAILYLDKQNLQL